MKVSGEDGGKGEDRIEVLDAATRVYIVLYGLVLQTKHMFLAPHSDVCIYKCICEDVLPITTDSGQDPGESGGGGGECIDSYQDIEGLYIYHFTIRICCII